MKLDFEYLKKEILATNVKSEYKQSSIIIIRNIFKEAETKQCDIHGVVCCDVLEKMKLEWMQLEDGTKCMPFIYGIDQKMYRVNNCPSCGKYVRDIMI